MKLVITVDELDDPSSSIDIRGVQTPAWVASLTYDFHKPPLEAMSVGGPGLAVDFTLQMWRHKKAKLIEEDASGT